MGGCLSATDGTARSHGARPPRRGSVSTNSGRESFRGSFGGSSNTPRVHASPASPALGGRSSRNARYPKSTAARTSLSDVSATLRKTLSSSLFAQGQLSSSTPPVIPFGGSALSVAPSSHDHAPPAPEFHQCHDATGATVVSCIGAPAKVNRVATWLDSVMDDRPSDMGWADPDRFAPSPPVPPGAATTRLGGLSRFGGASMGSALDPESDLLPTNPLLGPAAGSFLSGSALPTDVTDVAFFPAVGPVPGASTTSATTLGQPPYSRRTTASNAVVVAPVRASLGGPNPAEGDDLDCHLTRGIAAMPGLTGAFSRDATVTLAGDGNNPRSAGHSRGASPRRSVMSGQPIGVMSANSVVAAQRADELHAAALLSA